VRSLPEEFEVDALVAAVGESWGLVVDGAEYAPVGGGSYHWIVAVRGGRRAFVTVDDLDRKPWLGDTRESVFEGLKCAFDTSVALRDGGLGFVVAPIPTRSGESVIRLGPRYSIALFPFLTGRAGQFGSYEGLAPDAVQTMLAQLHQAPAATSPAVRLDLDLPGRGDLESALQEVDEVWLGGPFSERARAALSRNASAVVELLALADRLAADLPTDGWVVTHGEPHAANVMETDGGYVLLDWDTVAVGPRERDLWMLESVTGEEPLSYVDATGYKIDRIAMDFFRLTWELSDLAAFTQVLRSPHGETADTAWAYKCLLYCLAARERWTTVLG
jgi:spectinomycin phosphotransferase